MLCGGEIGRMSGGGGNEGREEGQFFIFHKKSMQRP